MKLLFFSMLTFCFLNFSMASYAESEPRFYLLGEGVLHNEKNEVLYEISKFKVAEKIMKDMSYKPKGINLSSPGIVNIPDEIVKKEIFPKPGEWIFAISKVKIKKYQVKEVFLDNHLSEDSYVLTYDRDVSNDNSNEGPAIRYGDENYNYVDVSVPESIPIEDLPKETKISPVFEKKVIREICEECKGASKDVKVKGVIVVTQFIKAMKKIYVISVCHIPDYSAIGASVYEVKKDSLKKICETAYFSD